MTVSGGALRLPRVIPVVVIQDADRAVPTARALLEGGIPCVEITFRTSAAAEALHRITAEVEGVLVGAGTVLTCEQVDLARDSGARFIVSPGFDRRVVEHGRANEIPVYPGVCTPTEIQRAVGMGLDVVKFFPAEPMGGASFLKAVSAPFPGLRFIPTGGITLQLLPSYLNLDQVLACGGSWLAPSAWIAEGAYERIREEAERAVAIASGDRPTREPPGGVERTS